MSRKITTRSLIILGIVLLFLYLIYPTIRFNITMSKADKEALQVKNPKEYEYLLTNSIKLGLDLQGGMHVVMEVDVKALLDALAKNKDERFKKALDEAAKEVSLSDKNLVTVFAQKLEATGADLARYYGNLTLQSRAAILKYLQDQTKEAVDRSLEILRNRVDEFGVSEPTIQKQGNHRIIVELAGITNPGRVRALLGKTAQLEFRLLKDAQIGQSIASRINAYLQGEKSPAESDTSKTEPAKSDSGTVKAEELFGKTASDTTGPDSAKLAEKKKAETQLFFRNPNDPQVLLIAKDNEARFREVMKDSTVQKIISEEGGDAQLLLGKAKPGFNYIPVYVVNAKPELTGETITDARAQMGSSYDPSAIGKFETSLTFNDDGARAFSRVTGANIGKRLAIVLDGRVHSAPTIQVKIRDGRARITGLDSHQEAQDLAIVLKAGALPAPLHILEERTVGPSLGRDSVVKGTYSAIMGLILVVLFMMVYYKFSGFVADVALLLNILLILGIMSYFHGTLTLPGIAGIILTIGMAVDANVLIFERIREELDKGKTIWSSIETGYGRAFITIFDANITTLIAGVVLYNFGSGPIKGFALTLMIGISASMFTAIFVTRTIFEMLLSKKILNRISI